MPRTRHNKIPLRKRDGTIRAYALVSPDDYAWAKNFKWALNGKGYVYRWVRKSEARSYATVYLHREVMGLQAGDGRIVDHINRDKLDNRRENLRDTTVAGNNQNVSPRGGGSSSFRGVCWAAHERRWMAQATVRSRRHFLGYFDNELAAADAARQFRQDNMPHAID